MITVGEIRNAIQGMSDHAEVKLDVVQEGSGWKLELVFTESPAAEVFHNRHPFRPVAYNANALIPGAAPSVHDPRD